MPRFTGQNKRRLDPRYFLEETVINEGSVPTYNSTGRGPDGSLMQASYETRPGKIIDGYPTGEFFIHNGRMNLVRRDKSGEHVGTTPITLNPEIQGGNERTIQYLQNQLLGTVYKATGNSVEVYSP